MIKILWWDSLTQFTTRFPKCCQTQLHSHASINENGIVYNVDVCTFIGKNYISMFLLMNGS